MGLRVENLSLARGGLPVLTGLSFELSTGEALILRGPNGAGKTTLLRTLAGLQAPLSGQVFGAEDQIAYAGHADGLKSMLSVAENLSFWAQVFGQSDISTALEAYALEPLADRLAGTLSAGQKRRLGLARLLVTGRAIWVLDEPTVSLDADAVAQFAGAVRVHLSGGGCALIATHIDLGLEAKVLDITPYRASVQTRVGASDEAFL
jgi:heme exporter protein A